MQYVVFAAIIWFLVGLATLIYTQSFSTNTRLKLVVCFPAIVSLIIFWLVIACMSEVVVIRNPRRLNKK